VPATDRRRDAFYLYCRQTGRWPNEVAGLGRDFDPAMLRTYCPEANVTADYPPTLLVHGTHDTDVPYQRSVEMAVAPFLAWGVVANRLDRPLCPVEHQVG
jgi:hypothetical protein